MDSAIPQTTAEIDRQIVALVGPDAAPKVQSMLLAQLEFSKISRNFAPRIEKQGYALTPDQRYALGVTLNEIYNPSLNPLAKSRDTLPVNPQTNLTELDEQAIKRLMPILTPPQISLLQLSLGNTNQAVMAKTK